MKKNIGLLLFSGFIILSITLMAWANTTITIKTKGIHGPARENIDIKLQKQFAKLAQPITEQMLTQYRDNIPLYVQSALAPFGYFKPKISFHLKQNKKNWLLSLVIVPGPVLPIANVDVTIIGEGKNDPAFQKLLLQFPIKIGQPLNIKKYQETKDAIIDLAAQRGYFDARMTTSQVLINLQKYSANIVLHFDTGARYRFGETTFGPSNLRESLLRRYLAYKVGDYFDNQLIQKTQQDLASSNYFQQVVVNPLPEGSAEQQVPVDIQLTPSSPVEYLVGAGYGTDTGIRGTLGVKVRNVNSYGHRFDTILRASQVGTSSIMADYYIPGEHPATDLYTVSAAAGTINQDTGKSESYKMGANYSTVIGNWRTVWGAYYLFERYNLEDLPKTDANMLVPNMHVERFHANPVFNQKNGYTLTFDMAGASEALISSSTFIQEKMEFRALKTLERTNTRLVTHVQLGRTDIDNLDHLPLSLQLFAGGASSVRGYSYNSIGPGRNLAVMSGEIQQHVAGKWYLAAFYDAGSVSNQNPFSDLKRGAGPGVVYLSPIGAIELTAAVRLNAADGDHDSWRIQVSMGPQL